MKKIIVLISLLLCIGVKAQNKATFSYFKDPHLLKETTRIRGNYERVELKKKTITSIMIVKMINNRIIRTENYKKERPIGVWKSYNAMGELLKERDFNKLVYSNKIFKNKHADFQAARVKKSEHDNNGKSTLSIVYPQEAREQGASGTVQIQIKIDKEGNVSPTSIVHSVHPMLDYEVWEFVEKMPIWDPATVNGVAVDSYFVLPLTFELKTKGLFGRGKKKK